MKLDQQRSDVKRLRECQLSISLAGIADRYERLILFFEAGEDWYIPFEKFEECQEAVLKDAKGERKERRDEIRKYG